MSLTAAIAAFVGFRATPADQFGALLDGLRQQLAPTTPMEILLVEQIVLAVSRLRNAARLEDEGKIDKDWLRYQTMAERSFWKSYNTLEKSRRQAARAAKAAPIPRPQPTPTPIPAPISPPSPTPTPAPRPTPAPALAAAG